MREERTMKMLVLDERGKDILCYLSMREEMTS